MASFNQTYAQYVSSQVANTGFTPGTTFLLGRVTHVVRGPFLAGTKVPDKYYKDSTSLGEITFQLISSVQSSTLDSAGNVTAKPFFAGFKQYPIQNELVYLVPGPSTEMNESRGSRSYYYLPPFNLWNASHHNAFPDLGDYSAYVNSKDRTYENTNRLNQSTNLSATGSLTFPLDPDFTEKPNIKSLRQFAGDVTVEGRWGNSIRLGSTSLNAQDENYWSKNSTPGNPITIIRNGQGKPSDDIPWIPTVENINRDPSSIYLTQGQQINIDDLKNFSLASLGVNITSTNTVSILIQQQLTSTDTLSAVEQDNFTHQGTNPTPV